MEPGAQLYAVAGARAQLQGLSLGSKRWLQHLRKGASGWSGSRSLWDGVGPSRTRPLFDPNPTALNPRGFLQSASLAENTHPWRKLAGENTRTESLALPGVIHPRHTDSSTHRTTHPDTHTYDNIGRDPVHTH